MITVSYENFKKGEGIEDLYAAEKSGQEAQISIDLATALNKQKLLEVCSEIKQTGLPLTILTSNYESVFSKDEIAALKENFAEANTILENGIGFSLGYTLEQAEYASDLVNGWVNDINSAQVNGQPLSPFEKYVYAYTIAADHSYKMEDVGDNSWQSRAIPSILDPNNDKMVCVGFADLLAVICNKCGIPAAEYGVNYRDTALGHQTTAIYLKDEKYDIENIFRANPTLGARDERGLFSLAGICNSFKGLTERYTEETDDNISRLYGKLGVAKPIAFETLLNTTAMEAVKTMQPNFDNSLPLDENVLNNYKERLRNSILPIIKNQLQNLDAKTYNIPIENILQDISLDLSRNMTMLNRQFDARQFEVFNNRYTSSSESELNFQQNIKDYNNSVAKLFGPQCAFLKGLGYSDDKILEIFDKSISELQSNESIVNLLNDEQMASKYFAFKQQVSNNSKELNPFALSIAVRNVFMAKGEDCVSACSKTSALMARSLISEFDSLITHDGFRNGEVFGMLIFENNNIYQAAQNYANALAETKNNEQLPPKKYEEFLRNEVFNHLYEKLGDYSFSEVVNDPSLYESHISLFEQYPALNNMLQQAWQEKGIEAQIPEADFQGNKMQDVPKAPTYEEEEEKQKVKI